MASTRGESEKPFAHEGGLVWDHILPQSLDDRSIHGAAKTLFDQIQLHVENFYVAADVDINANVAANMARVQTPYLSDPAALLAKSSTSTLPVIKQCLAYTISHALGDGVPPAESLLPPLYAVVMQQHKVNDVNGSTATGE